MATFVVYSPGPSVNEEYADFESCFEAACSQFQFKSIGGGGGAPAGTYNLALVASGSGAQPYVAFNYSSGTDTVSVRYRYWAGLEDTLDPSSALGATNLFPVGVIGANTYAELQAWIAAVGTASVANCWGGFTAWLSGLTASASLGVSATALTYTDGPRAGGTFGYRMIFSYNPSPTEVAAGIRQLVATRHGIVSDAGDGSVNVFEGDAELGTAVRAIPQVVYGSPASTEAWDDLTDAIGGLGESWLGDPGYVTHPSDLGEVDRPSAEPTTPKGSVYRDPGTAPQVYVDPSLFDKLTTTTSIVLSAIGALGRLVAAVAEIGFFTAILSKADAALTSLENLGTLPSTLTSIATSLNGQLAHQATIATRMTEIRDLIDAKDLTINLSTVVDAIEANTGALVQVRDHHGTLVTLVEGTVAGVPATLANQGAALVTAAGVTIPGAIAPVASELAAIRTGTLTDMRNRLQEIADRLRASSGTCASQSIPEILCEIATRIQEIGTLHEAVELKVKGVTVRTGPLVIEDE